MGSYPGATPIRDFLFFRRHSTCFLDEGMKKMSHVTVSGDGGTREMVSHVTVAEAWEGEGVTCNGLWGLGWQGAGVTCNGFWDVEDEGRRCHM